ncbi:collagen alpha-1(I) chain-like [Dipodomys merriami]|uniref:collagen alpha-1(I) chain-like n=1 Tax=Dipodomys merriami TaxID=94247 RepID=UPI003855FB1B
MAQGGTGLLAWHAPRARTPAAAVLVRRGLCPSPPPDAGTNGPFRRAHARLPPAGHRPRARGGRSGPADREPRGRPGRGPSSSGGRRRGVFRAPVGSRAGPQRPESVRGTQRGKSGTEGRRRSDVTAPDTRTPSRGAPRRAPVRTLAPLHPAPWGYGPQAAWGDQTRAAPRRTAVPGTRAPEESRSRKRASACRPRAGRDVSEAGRGRGHRGSGAAEGTGGLAGPRAPGVWRGRGHRGSGAAEGTGDLAGPGARGRGHRGSGGAGGAGPRAPGVWRGRGRGAEGTGGLAGPGARGRGHRGSGGAGGAGPRAPGVWRGRGRGAWRLACVRSADPVPQVPAGPRGRPTPPQVAKRKREPGGRRGVTFPPGPLRESNPQIVVNKAPRVGGVRAPRRARPGAAVRSRASGSRTLTGGGRLGRGVLGEGPGSAVGPSGAAEAEAAGLCPPVRCRSGAHGRRAGGRGVGSRAGEPHTFQPLPPCLPWGHLPGWRGPRPAIRFRTRGAGFLLPGAALAVGAGSRRLPSGLGSRPPRPGPRPRRRRAARPGLVPASGARARAAPGRS